MTPTQPTTDEVAREIEEIAEKLHGQRHANSRPYSWLNDDTKADFRAMAKWVIDTHSAKLRAENEGLDGKLIELSGINDDLRTQNELLQSQLSECVKLIQHFSNIKKLPMDQWLDMDDVERKSTDLLSTLPTTPNLCEQVRKLEEALRVRIQHGECPECRCNFFAGNHSEACRYFKLEQTINQKAE